MIRRFRHKGLQTLFESGKTSGVDQNHVAKLRRMLLLLQAGPLPDAMRLPGYKLHQLKGDQKGVWAAWVSGNYRLTFEIEGEDATNFGTATTISERRRQRMKNMEMFNPPHPGEAIREDCIGALALSVTETAKGLGISRQSLSELINGRTGVSAEMAMRLELAGWGTAEGWLRSQAAYDLWVAKQRIKKLKVHRFAEPDVA